MININVDDIRQSTYYSMLRKLTEEKAEKLCYLRNHISGIVRSMTYDSKWFADEIRIDEFDLVQILLYELQIKGFKVKYVSQNQCINFEGEIHKIHYYTLEIKWELEN